MIPAPMETVERRDAGRGVTGAVLAAVLAVVALVYARALAGELVYDDLLLVARNPALASWENLSAAFGGAHWDFVEPDQAQRVGYWRPLALVALYVGRMLGDGAPTGFHAVSLVLHLAATATVFALARRLLGNRTLLGPAAAALLFGLHPVHVEAVAWISAVNDPLAGLFTLLSLLALVRWRDRGSDGVAIVPAVLLLLALLSKESALAWFALAPAIDALRGDLRKHLLRAYAPALGALALYWLARAQVFESANAGFDLVTSHLHESAVRALTLRVELLGGGLALLAWPAKLNLFREVRPEIPWSDAQLWTAVGVLVVWLSVALVLLRRGARTAALALFLSFAALAPAVLRLESIGRFPLSDRFLYLSVFGFALLAGVVVERLPRRIGLAAALVLAGLFGWRVHQRIPVWHDEVTLFRDGVAQSPRSMYVRWGLGRVLLDRFRVTNDAKVLFEANDQFQAAQDLSGESIKDGTLLVTAFDEIQSTLGLGWYHLLCALHLPDECVLEESELVFRNLADRIPLKAPGSAEAHCGLGVSLARQGRTAEAEAELRKALECNERHQASWFNLGRVQLDARAWPDALQSFQKATELAPDDVDAWLSLGMTAIELDLGDRAREALGRARALAPDNAAPLLQLGVMAARESRPQVALEFFESALKLDGSDGAAHLMRGKALLQLGRQGDALRAFSDAARWLQEPSDDPLRPQQLVEAFYNAGVLTLQSSPRDALPLLEEALQRDPQARWTPGLREAVDKLRRELESSK